jgi:hypothetical protein
MKLAYAIIIIGFASSNICNSQSTENEVSIGPGLDASKAFPIEAKYRFPKFQSGYLITFEGKRSQNLLLNFNLFSEVPQFIDAKGDTLFLDEHLAEFVHIEEKTYYNRGGSYYEIISATGPITLAVKRKWRVVRIISNNAVGERVGDAQVNTQERRGALIFSPALGKMVRNENTVYELGLAYFLVDKNKTVQKANKSGFMKIVRDKKSKLEAFIETERIDFDKEKDLIYLVEMINKDQLD